MHKEDKDKSLHQDIYYMYFFSLYYKFIWCILANVKTLTGGVSSHPIKTIVFFLNRQEATLQVALCHCLYQTNIISLLSLPLVAPLLRSKILGKNREAQE